MERRVLSRSAVLDRLTDAYGRRCSECRPALGAILTPLTHSNDSGRSSFDFDATFSSTEKVPEFPVDWVPVPSFIFQVPPLAFDTKLNQSLIVHLASNCVEEREGFVDAMQRYGLSVDRFGTCSTIDTPPPHAMRPLPSHRDSRSQWKEELYHVYRFCTAMENARSPNYISEKVWEALRVGCIPRTSRNRSDRSERQEKASNNVVLRYTRSLSLSQCTGVIQPYSSVKYPHGL